MSIKIDMTRLARDLRRMEVLAGCEKLPEALRENCEKKQEEGKENKEGKTAGDQPPRSFEQKVNALALKVFDKVRSTSSVPQELLDISRADLARRGLINMEMVWGAATGLAVEGHGDYTWADLAKGKYVHKDAFWKDFWPVFAPLAQKQLRGTDWNKTAGRDIEMTVELGGQQGEWTVYAKGPGARKFSVRDEGDALRKVMAKMTEMAGIVWRLQNAGSFGPELVSAEAEPPKPAFVQKVISNTNMWRSTLVSYNPTTDQWSMKGGLGRLASNMKRLAELRRERVANSADMRTAARWVKRHDKAIEAWIAKNPNFRGYDVPKDLMATLKKINDYESLDSDADRHFGDALMKAQRSKKAGARKAWLEEKENTERLEELAGGMAGASKMLALWKRSVQIANTHDTWSMGPISQEEVFIKSARRERFSDKAIAFYVEEIQGARLPRNWKKLGATAGMASSTKTATASREALNAFDSEIAPMLEGMLDATHEKIAEVIEHIGEGQWNQVPKKLEYAVMRYKPLQQTEKDFLNGIYDAYDRWLRTHR
jgi:hypothetical protein